MSGEFTGFYIFFNVGLMIRPTALDVAGIANIIDLTNKILNLINNIIRSAGNGVLDTWVEEAGGPPRPWPGCFFAWQGQSIFWPGCFSTPIS